MEISFGNTIQVSVEIMFIQKADLICVYLSDHVLNKWSGYFGDHVLK